ncbi:MULTISPECIES: VOC family protein [unclassified Microbacterium]|uniref:VOC family protein n=1 Tax=unclassified Microbacterium TaxID=2609290 RepID=UPI00214BB8E0|nr:MULTISPECIES: VOC family protein [unclassified Microbacterium]MCR2808375.1 VOC family protein [Microbacterium sp. zg.B185]WIM19179.1 VOC family protein [Microbacterium sp. zg-B185]
MTADAPLIHHIGFLVADLEAAIAHWSKVTGYTFSPIARYRTERYADASNPEPHWHDARISFSLEGPPHIELMEFHGAGTHAVTEGEGFHHLGFMNTPDIEARMAQMQAMGFTVNGQSIDENGHVVLWFTDKADLGNVRLEYVSADPQPIVDDSGALLELDSDGKPDLWSAR